MAEDPDNGVAKNRTGRSDGRQNDEDLVMRRRKRKEAAVAILLDFVVVFVVLRRCFGIMRSMVRDVELFGTKTFSETGQSERDPVLFPFSVSGGPREHLPRVPRFVCSMYGGRDCSVKNRECHFAAILPSLWQSRFFPSLLARQGPSALKTRSGRNRRFVLFCWVGEACRFFSPFTPVQHNHGPVNKVVNLEVVTWGDVFCSVPI